MTAKRLAVASLVLWCVGAAGLGLLFVRGQTRPGGDGRTAIVLTAGERDFVLGEMRGLLAAEQGVAQALADGDRAALIQAAHGAGMAGVGAVPPALMLKLPLEFKRAGMAMHAGFDDVAAAAAQGDGWADLRSRFAAHLGHCVACHQAWRLQAAP
ncbi:hypothetical protein GALL_159070 [mine drainage metagenome]|uniref:Cytochrome c n=1 Tax=mine drainage metagenome TaxID=410659 RepID=A0A1J5S0Y6_9ZZZZ